MNFCGKVRERVKSYLNPDTFDALDFRSTVQMATLGMVLGELTIYILLRQSVHLGELPDYITDVLIISISAVEFLLGPFIGWLGTQRRRTIMVMWVLIALVGILPAFGAPGPEAVADTALCSSLARFLPSGISMRAAIRLSILILSAITCALGRLAITAHGLAYLDESRPSHNTHMNFAILIVVRVVVLHLGSTIIGGMLVKLPWLQILAIVLKFIFISIKLQKFPDVPPAVDMKLGSERAFFPSLGRVVGSKVAMLQILSMSLLAAALWGFGTQEAKFTKVKFHVVPGEGMMWELTGPFRAVFLIMITILTGYMYTEPVMPVFKTKRAVRNVARMTNYCLILFVLVTHGLDCAKGTLAGMDESTYNQPACAGQCGCDRPWTEFSPVCVSEELTTYFSPCHAGCATVETTDSGLGFYSNCSCAPSGRVMSGACSDGSCVAAYAMETLLFSGIVLAGVIALALQSTVLFESVDRRDKSVALGLASGTISLFAFVGGHAFYMWISNHNCAQFRGEKCLWHKQQFTAWVGYTSAILAGASLLVTAISYIIIYRQKKKEKRAEAIDLTRD